MNGKSAASRLLLLTFGLVLASCSSSTDESRKPAGTPTDPVMTCERHGQVCRIDTSRLGVCIEAKEENRQELCNGQFPCLQCTSQH